MIDYDQFQKHNCMRIKILGDCYYCISGLPTPDPEDKDKIVSNPDHAKNSVQMGLEMIDLIREVREQFSVPGLDMRIGVHTGTVLSGLIGLRKWQFDIWSNDVTIANHMESSGSPGAVHITEKTMDQLDGKFKCEEVQEMSDQVIVDSGLKTFLIKSKSSSEATKISKIRGRQFSEDSGVGSNESTSSNRVQRVVIQEEPEVRMYETSFSGRRNSSAVALRRNSVAILPGAGGRRGSTWAEDDSFSAGPRRKSMLMDSGLSDFKKMVENTDDFMEKEIEQLPIRIQE